MPKKLPRAARRTQLLETASEIVREQGTDALTLGFLAERAGVSKPIAYDHFKTRSGLMITLAKAAMDRQVAALVAALEGVPPQPERIARILAVAYLECAVTIGPEWYAINAALQGDPMMESYLQEMRSEHATFYAETVQPMSNLDPTDVRRRCVGLVAAMEAMSNETVAGRIGMEDALEDITSLIVTWVIFGR